MGESGSKRAKRVALSLFASELVDSQLVRKSGKLSEPIEVRRPDGGAAGWFVPVIVGERIAGHFQFDEALRLLRYASYQRHADRVDDCPPASAWIDRASILERARGIAGPDEGLQEPILSYDVNASRLAWMVEARRPDGRRRRIYVAGEYAFEEPSRGGH